MNIQECINNVPDGWKRFCLQFLHDKSQWKIEYKSKGQWELQQPDTNGYWNVYKMRSRDDWHNAHFIQKMGWEITKKDILTPVLERLKSELQEMF